MQNNFRELEELVFFDLWIPDSGFRIPDSRFQIPDSGFWILDSGFWIPDSSFWFPHSGFRIPDSVFRSPGFRVAPTQLYQANLGIFRSQITS